MRLLAVLILASFATAASADNLHKCAKPGGGVYYTDRACSPKNQRDHEQILHKEADQKPAPPPPQKKKKKK